MADPRRCMIFLRGQIHLLGGVGREAGETNFEDEGLDGSCCQRCGGGDCAEQCHEYGRLTTGAVNPHTSQIMTQSKIISLLLNRLKGLHCLIQERDRLAAKRLSKVSRSRERFLLEKGRGGHGTRSKEPPTETLASKLSVFVRMQEGQSIEQLTDTIQTIERE